MIEKELRALLPVWAVCAGGLLATALNLPLPVRGAGAGVYILSCAALGGLAFGHEYSHGTMAWLLAQPTARRRVYLVKLGVLAFLLFALRTMLFVVPFPEDSTPFGPLFVALPLLAALFLAPWLTLLTRSPLAGAMFSLSLASVVLLVAERVATGGYGFSDEFNLFKIGLIRWPMLALCAAGAVLGWRAFAHLEIIEGQVAPLFHGLPFTSAADSGLPIRRRGPILMLIGKELRLQQITFLIAGLFVVTYLGVVGRREPLEDLNMAVVMISTHLIVISLLTGSLASAEERHLGTLEWQLLLPISSLRQWMVKVGTALAVILALGVALPIALAWMLPPAPGPLFLGALPSPPMAATAGVLLGCVSLYVSSLVSSGLRALLIAVPSILACRGVVSILEGPVRHIALRGSGDLSVRLTMAARLDLLLAALALVLVSLLYPALLNHRSTDRRGIALPWQFAYIGLGLTFIVFVAETLSLL